MWVGDVVADRFVLERPIGSGGMGTVFYAIDRIERRPVALKVVDQAVGGARDRFQREARVLAELTHPSIVRYVAHGQTPDSELYLVMEWLEGEDLSKRLARGPLSLQEALFLSRRVADGLAQAHARGVVHRDVKPSNVFLIQRDPRQVVLLDFGVARVPSTRRWTRTGTVVGTVGYMAPEQARGESETDARADVFGLGCVLFECVTGAPAFGGPHELAVLAKLLAGDPPRLARHRPDLGEDLDALVSKMLAQDPGARPQDGAAVRDALDSLKASGEPAAVPSGSVPHERASAQSHRGLTGSERRVRSVLFAQLWPEEDTGSTLTPDALADERESLKGMARKFGADVTWLPGSRLLFGFGGARSASDLAALAAACAAELRSRFPGAKIAVATGTADTGSDVAMGPVIDQVAILLARVAAAQIALDDVTAGLLPGRFVTEERAGVRTLERVVALDDEPRPLMGRRTPCVGRERELAALEALLDTSVTEAVSGAAVVVGEAGMGKTRLRQEFVMRAKKRHPNLTVLASRGDLMNASSPFAVVRQLVRSAFGLLEGAPDPDAGSRIRAGVGQLVPGADAQRIGDFIGELVAVRHAETPTIPLQAAREDPSLMAQWLHRSFVEWLGALAKFSPVLVVIDDLHWADSSSIAWLDDALRAHPEASLAVLGLGRPELRERAKPFVAQQEIILDALRRRASEDLVRAVLPEASAEDVARLVLQSRGNVFYLEELARHVASGATDLPATVLAMAQTRLEELDPGARSVLRAASVFGERFWRGSVEAILGERGGDTDRWLGLLASDELVAASPASRLQDAEEYVFRHALVREAAYASFTDDDRRVAHFFAAHWLETAGETDAITMIEHYERGGAAGEATGWYIAAATSARLARSWDAVDDLTRRGLLVATGEDRGALLSQRGYALGARTRFEEARETCLEALQSSAPTCPHWALSVTVLAAACTYLGDPTTPFPFLCQLVEAREDPEPQADLAHSLYQAYWFAAATGRTSLAGNALAMFERIASRAKESPVVEGWLGHALGVAAHFETKYFPQGTANTEKVTETGEAAGHRFLFESGRLLRSWNALYIGNRELAEDELSKGCVLAALQAFWSVIRVMAAVSDGDLEGAEDATASAVGGASTTAELQARTLLALAYSDAGRPDDAERLLDDMPEKLAGLLGNRTDVHMARARVALARGAGDKALIVCQEAEEAANRWGGYVIIRQLTAQSRAEALRMLDQNEDAHRVARALRDEIFALAAQMDEATRASYLARGFPSARILRVTGEWQE